MWNPFKLQWKEVNPRTLRDSEALLKEDLDVAGDGTGEAAVVEVQSNQIAKNNPTRSSNAPNYAVNILAWRVASAIMGIFFLLCGIVQHNDPDPTIWMVAYAIPCIISWIFAFTKKMAPVDSKEMMKRTKSLQHTNVTACRLTSLNSRVLLDIMIAGHIFYCCAIGVWTLIVYFYWGGSGYGISNSQMNAEEAKELLGLCLIITWLSLLQNYNFMHLGRCGVYLAIMLTVTPIFAWVLIEIYEKEYEMC